MTVSIAGQTMTTLLQSDGTWNVTPTSVGEGTWPVVASVTDRAGNVGRAGQSLTIAMDASASTGEGADAEADAPAVTPTADPDVDPITVAAQTQVTGAERQRVRRFPSPSARR